MARLVDIDTTDAPKHILVFGPPKAGKTELVMKLGSYYKLDYIDLERGSITGKKLPPEVQANINVITIADTKNNPVAMQCMTNLFKSGKLCMCVTHNLHDCQVCKKLGVSAAWEDLSLVGRPKDSILVIDSLTQFSNSVMNHIGKDGGDDWNPGWPEFRKQGSYLDMILSEIQNAPYHVIVITHEVGSEMEDGKEKLVPVAGTRNFSRNTAKYFDTVVYCEVKNGRHVSATRTNYSNLILTGDRLGVDIEKANEGLLSIFKGDRSGNAPAQQAGTVKPNQTVKVL